jgi:hypothetical protein
LNLAGESEINEGNTRSPMSTATEIDPRACSPCSWPPIRLAFSRVFLRVFAIVFLIGEFGAWKALKKLAKGRPPFAKLVAMIYFTVPALLLAFVAGAIAAVSADVIVRYLIRPLLGYWYNPRVEDTSFGSPASFHLASDERLEDELPARLMAGRRRVAGTLALTNRRLWFFPTSWDADPLSVRFEDVAEIQCQAPRIAAWGAIRGWPDMVVVRCRSDESYRFAIANPSVVLDWFEESDIPRFLHHD